MEKFRLERPGDLPLSFEGEQLNESNGRWFAGRDQNRWHDLTIYRTKGGRYLLQIEYSTQWQGESDHSEVIDCGPEMANVIAELKAYDPAAYLLGFPPGQQYEERQAKLIQDLNRRYKHQITELFKDIPEAEEKID